MPKPQKEEKRKIEFSFPVYSDFELNEFKVYLEKFRTEPRDVEYDTKKDGSTVHVKHPANSYIDELKWMQEEGALGVNGGVVMDETFPIKYEVCKNKMQQLMNYSRRAEYRDRKQIEGLEEIASTMSVGDLGELSMI